jgi:voltage-gated potassium channel Kch
MFSAFPEPYFPTIIRIMDPAYFGNLYQLFRAKKVRDYSDALDGFPARVSGHFARMFYLSTVTITTLGVGDVLPITMTTRLLVALEAILGVALIGLFLNSLAQGRNEHIGVFAAP